MRVHRCGTPSARISDRFHITLARSPFSVDLLDRLIVEALGTGATGINSQGPVDGHTFVAILRYQSFGEAGDDSASIVQPPGRSPWGRGNSNLGNRFLCDSTTVRRSEGRSGGQRLAPFEDLTESISDPGRIDGL